MRLLRLAAAGAFGLAWLLPNHYYPWSSFWQDLAAAIGLSLLYWSVMPMRLIRSWVPSASIVVVLVAAIPLLQWAGGGIFYKGDAFIACFYLCGLAFAMALPVLGRSEPEEVIAPLVWAVLLASIASVGLAAAQWLEVSGLGIFLMDYAPGARPYANLAQPNQLATLLLWGIVAAIAMTEQRILNGVGCVVVLAWLLTGLAMTQSRTAWIAMAALLVWLFWQSNRAPWRIRRPALVAIGVVFVVFVLAWPAANQFLGLASARDLTDGTSANVRLQLWLQMLDAISHAPWLGYGWNQISVAQIRVAQNHAPTGQWIEHAHNLVLELMVMQGLPLALLVCGCIAFWLWKRMRACCDPRVALALGAILVVGVHAMLEYPLDYAYFLLPMGIAAGYVEARTPSAKRFAMPTAWLWIMGLLATVVLIRIGYEYIDVERRNRAMRFEQAGYGPQDPEIPPTPIYLLTQLEELPRFARTQARRGMTAQELDDMRKMAERYAYPPVLLRYALANGLNGNPASAGVVLRVLCHVHSPERCEEGLLVWRQMAAGAFPELQETVLPEMPRRHRDAPVTQ